MSDAVASVVLSLIDLYDGSRTKFVEVPPQQIRLSASLGPCLSIGSRNHPPFALPTAVPTVGLSSDFVNYFFGRPCSKRPFLKIFYGPPVTERRVPGGQAEEHPACRATTPTTRGRINRKFLWSGERGFSVWPVC